ncbi:MAG TPA: beta-L-arabinofuranosidase domain-containing protein [Candidatus Angelobacter sp.]|nr:beta-L-arabinofuranosidase domain-containing protein [Candidatus Angelobacter sp.]
MSQTHRWNRRQWISTAAATGAATLLPSRSFAGLERVFGFGAAGPAREAVDAKLKAFPLSQVRLRPGIFLDQLESNQSFVESLPNDRLLHTFRLTAKIPSSADPLGGWEHPRGELRGHFAGGHVLSACALLHAATGDDAVKQKGNELVAELAKCQEKLNADGYLSAYPTSFYDRLRDGKRVWAPFYTYHKILAGHLDMYTHCGNEQALATAQKMAQWTDKYLKPLSDEQWAKMQMVEHGGMNESLFNLYGITGKEQYLALARRFEHKKFFDPLAEQKDELKGLHANTNIPKVIGAARGYELTGDQRYHDIADYFWHEVVSQRTYCTGGTSNGEGWQTEPGKFADQLGGAAEECCCGYNMMKLTRHIFSWTGEPSAMDYYERTLFNSRLGTQDSEGMKMYYLSLFPGLWRTFGTRWDSFWCCTGTGAEEFAKLGDTIYFHDEQGVYVNLFIASELSWPEKKVTLVQETSFPEEEGTTLTVKARTPVKMAVHLRVPYWATNGMTVSINGKKQDVAATPSSYLIVDRTWNDGDKVQVTMPMSLHVAPLPDDPTMQAAMYGPLVLAGRLGTRGLVHERMYGPLVPDDARAIPVADLTNSSKSGDWVEPVKGQTLAFQTAGQRNTIDIIPFYRLYDERYTVYWKVAGKTA